jgi:hypothetical protein
MPNRIVRDGILTSVRVDRIADQPATEVFYRRLQSVVDDYGIYHAHPSLLRAALYPLRIDRTSDSDIASHLEVCVSAGLILLYSTDGKDYVQLLDFRQRTRAMKSKFPQPSDGQPDSARAGRWRAADIKRSHDGHAAAISQTQNSPHTENTEVQSYGGHMAVIGQSNVCPPRAETETETETEAGADGAVPTDQFFEERYALHPKKKDRVLAEQALCQIAGIGTLAVQDKFRAGHDAWIGTDDYRWKGGAKCPTFAEFITDRTWQYLPHATNTASAPSPYVPYRPPADVENQESFEDQLARARAPQARNSGDSSVSVSSPYTTYKPPL